MRITLVIGPLSAGGAENSVVLLANHWAQKGWDITIAAFAEEGETPFYRLEQEVCYHPLGLTESPKGLLSRVQCNIQRVRRLRKLLKKNSPQIIVSQLEWVNVLSRIATIGLGIPVIATEQNDPSKFACGASWRTLRNFLYPCCSRVVAVSEGIRQNLRPWIRPNTIVIPNPVVAPPTEGTPSTQTEETGKTILAMGRLVEQKGFDLLLQIFSQIANRFPEWNLIIYGEGSLREQLEEQRNSLGLTERVSFPGLVKEPYLAMIEADVFVLSSRHEGHPRVLSEAMACGLPAVSFDCPSGPAEIISNQLDGFLIPPGDLSGFAKALARLFEDEDLRSRIGENASKIVQRYGLEQISKEWRKLFDELLINEDSNEQGCAV